MAIHKPGERYRYNKFLKKKFEGRRSVTATLSLTAMVDMFTVLVIFLLQNYNTTGEVIFLPKEVKLPNAQQIKELKPAHVVTISDKEILVEDQPIMRTSRVRAQEQWMLRPLRAKLVERMREKKKEVDRSVKKRLRQAVGRQAKDEDVVDWRKVTVQCDKGIDILTVKKVMYTATEAGASEINFAVMKSKDD